MGLNLGGDEKGPNLAENLKRPLTREDKAYRDEAWRCEEGKAQPCSSQDCPTSADTAQSVNKQ